MERWPTIAPLPVPCIGPGRQRRNVAYMLGGADSSETPRNHYRYERYQTYATLPQFSRQVESLRRLPRGENLQILGLSESKSRSDLEITTSPIRDVRNRLSNCAQDGPWVRNRNYTTLGWFNLMPIVTDTRKTYRYDPATNTWNDTVIADLPVARSNAVGASFNGGGVLAGGISGNALPLATAIAWNQVSNTWSDLPNMLGGRSNASGAVLNGSFYVVGGFFGTGTNSVQKLTCPPAPTPPTRPSPFARMRVDHDLVASRLHHPRERAQYSYPAIDLADRFGVPDALAKSDAGTHGPPGSPGCEQRLERHPGGRVREPASRTNNLESAIAVHLGAGTYTGIVRGNGNTTGVGWSSLRYRSNRWAHWRT